MARTAGYSYLEAIIVVGIVGTLASLGLYTGLIKALVPAFWANPEHERVAERYAAAHCYNVNTDVDLDRCLDFRPSSCRARLAPPIRQCLHRHLTGFNHDAKAAERCAQIEVAKILAAAPIKSREACGPMLATLETLRRQAALGAEKPGDKTKARSPSDQAVLDELYGPAH